MLMLNQLHSGISLTRRARVDFRVCTRTRKRRMKKTKKTPIMENRYCITRRLEIVLNEIGRNRRGESYRTRPDTHTSVW